jgi:hypothetical protein
MCVKDIHSLNPGNHFYFKDFEWIALENVYGGLMAIMARPWGEPLQPFSSNNNNNYADSDLRKSLLEKLLPVLGEDNLLPHTVDITADNGDDEYGYFMDSVFILSVEEYRKYRDYVPLCRDWMWTRTPWITHSTEVRAVSDCGRVHELDVGSVEEGYGASVLPVVIFSTETLKVHYRFPELVMMHTRMLL